MPLDLTAWKTKSTRSEALARQLLEPTSVRGTLVCTDTAGLSRMTASMPLVDVLVRIRKAKQRIHAVGTAMGGQAIGQWVADNTTLFFPSDIGVNTIVRAIHGLHGDPEVQFGAAVHTGTFYRIGSELHGPQAERTEHLAEDHAKANETLVTDETCNEHQLAYAHHRDHGIFGRVQVVDQPGSTVLGTDTAYPEPYGPQMAAWLDELGDQDRPGSDAQWVLDSINQTFSRTSFLALLSHERARPVMSLQQTVQALFEDDLFSTTVVPILARFTDAYALSRGLGLAAFDDVQTATDALRAVQHALDATGIALTAGVDRGQVYVFPLPQGGHQFAGDPVNRASKIAEDLAPPGTVHLTDAATAEIDTTDGSSIDWEISGIRIRAHQLKM